MKLVKFKISGEPEVHSGLIKEDRVHELANDVFGPYDETGRVYDFDQVQLQAPCRPGKVVAVGLNYRDHAEELGLDLPTEPILFMKPSTTVIGPGEPIMMTRMSNRVDYEAELGVVIGKRAKFVERDRALDFVLGYTCVNDVTARDLQQKDGQWTRAKGFDTFCPLGPVIVTDLDPADLAVSAWLNGENKQSSRTSNLVFDVPALIEFISTVMTLEPGDVIATGTPSGIGPMNAGDEIEIRVEGIGSLINPLSAG